MVIIIHIININKSVYRYCNSLQTRLGALMGTDALTRYQNARGIDTSKRRRIE